MVKSSLEQMYGRKHGQHLAWAPVRVRTKKLPDGQQDQGHGVVLHGPLLGSLEGLLE